MLTLTDVKITFMKGTPNEKTGLDGVSLHLDDGDFVTIIGANGAGKSTLFNIIAGTYITDEGTIELDGRDITMTPDYKRSKYIGRLFQDPMKGTAPNMSIEDNLFLSAGRGGWLSKITKADKNLFRDRLALLDMGLEDKMKKPVGLLSGGQRQAISLMMATINPPKLLLLDEHTAALDPTSGAKVIELTKKIVEEEKLTCLMITHNMNSALELGNKTVMMHNGKILFNFAGEERRGLTVSDLLEKFKKASGGELDNDRMILN